MAPIIQYSSYAVKYFLAVRPNSSKLKVVFETCGGCEIIVENFGRFEQINLDTLRSQRAPGIKVVFLHLLCPKVLDNMVVWAYNTRINQENN
jgi:hypothetical protein